VSKTVHNVGRLACILGLTNSHNQSPLLPRHQCTLISSVPPLGLKADEQGAGSRDGNQQRAPSRTFVQKKIFLFFSFFPQDHPGLESPSHPIDEFVDVVRGGKFANASLPNFGLSIGSVMSKGRKLGRGRSARGREVLLAIAVMIDIAVMVDCFASGVAYPGRGQTRSSSVQKSTLRMHDANVKGGASRRDALRAVSGVAVAFLAGAPSSVSAAPTTLSTLQSPLQDLLSPGHWFGQFLGVNSHYETWAVRACAYFLVPLSSLATFVHTPHVHPPTHTHNLPRTHIHTARHAYLCVKVYMHA